MNDAPPPPSSPHPEAVSSEWILRPAGRPLFVLAHQDDETVLSASILRTVGDDERGTFVWWTNGDGLHEQRPDLRPEQYGRLRIDECTRALEILGGSACRKIDLETSEVVNYRLLTHVAGGGSRARQAIDHFLHEADRIDEVVRRANPDRVFVLAYQGGHPEHDLVHAMTARAVRRLRRQRGGAIPIIQCPAYEYGILCALRFKPWFSGDRRRLQLSAAELDRKRAALEAYPSQAKLMADFRTVLEILGLASLLRGRRTTPDEWIATEELGVTDPELDYTRSTHHLERGNYMFDHYQGIPIRFDTMVRPVVRAIFALG